jgi:hypothetical protein
MFLSIDWFQVSTWCILIAVCCWIWISML